MPLYKRVHNKFKLNGVHYDYEQMKEVAYSYIKEGEPFERMYGDFLTDWLNEDEFIIARTSGSTGKPKNIKLLKEHMVNSAIATADFFDIYPGDKALLCLPGNYIAGKMMLVRAIILGLEIDLTEPTLSPVFDYIKPYSFCSMLPSQLTNMVEYVDNIKNILVGGAVVSRKLKERIQGSPANIFETYGMTETITHIAARRLNNFDRSPIKKEEWHYFTTLPNVNISQDLRGCLVIDAPFVSSHELITNDVVKLHSERTFEWLGRIDNMINSGGIKIYPETVENKLSNQIKHRFFIAQQEDDILGQRLIIVIEGDPFDLDDEIFKSLDKYEVPKHVYFLPKFENTFSGKIQREDTLKLLEV